MIIQCLSSFLPKVRSEEWTSHCSLGLITNTSVNCNDDANKGRADEVYEKALRDLELMSDEEFVPLLGKLIRYYVERVVSSEPLGPGHVRVTTNSGGGSGRIAAAADGGSAAATTVSGGGRGRC